MAHRENAYEARAAESGQMPSGEVATTVLHVGGLNWASEKAVVEEVLGRRPGVRLVEANPVSQTATDMEAQIPAADTGHAAPAIAVASSDG